MANTKRARKNSSSTPKKRQKLSAPNVSNTKSDKNDPKQPEESLQSEKLKSRAPGQIRTPPPEPPPSVPASQALIPPEADDPSLREIYDIHTIVVVANSKIQDKVRRVLSLMLSVDGNGSKPQSEAGPHKSSLVALVSRAAAVNKCISVAEIAKRELDKTEVRVWQYTGSWSRLEAFEPKPKAENIARDDAETNSDTNIQTSADINDDESFEVMEIPTRKMVRNVPCLVIYLSRQAIPRLKDLYG